MSEASYIGRRARVLALQLGLCISLVLSIGPSRIVEANLPHRQNTDEVAFRDQMRRGEVLMQAHKYEEALKTFKLANEMRDKRSAECFLWMAQAYQGLTAYKNVVESCEKAIELGGGDAQLRAQAYNLEGLALESQAQGKDQKKLQQAEASLKQGIATGVALPVLHYNLGVVLIQQNRDAEGIAELKKYLQDEPRSANAEEARKIIDNPRRAREAYAPDFSFTTLEHEFISLSELRGKVVLLDFWGTWCGPCVASVPSLRVLYKKLAKEPGFVMIGISSDSDERKLRDFVAKNDMTWHEYLDRDRRVARTFEVRGFPTYVIIDHEGIVKYRYMGANFERAAMLEDAIRKLLKAAKTQASERAPSEK